MQQLSDSTFESDIARLKDDYSGKTPWADRHHLLDTDDLSKDEVDYLIRLAGIFSSALERKEKLPKLLDGKLVANVFYENSTRTRVSFEIAARRLGAQVVTLDAERSSLSKGETIKDTAATLAAMGIDAIVQRHGHSGSAHQLAREIPAGISILNAGDGWNAHPTQALLDLFTMLSVKSDLSAAKIAIIGDITHSRVARSNIFLLKLYGADIHIAGPPTLLPEHLSDLGVTVHNRPEPALAGADFVMALRLQKERQSSGLIPSIGEYKNIYRLDHERIKHASPHVRVLHPGPVNRDVELTDSLADDPELSLVNRQVKNGVPTRMAALYLLLAKSEVDS